MQTLDFSTTPDGSAGVVRVQRLLFLKQILDRIELPPDSEIPGADEVANGAVTEWTIPDTLIRIRRIEQGPRAGEFLFSADSVQRLDRLYRQRQLLFSAGSVDRIRCLVLSSCLSSSAGISPRLLVCHRYRA